MGWDGRVGSVRRAHHPSADPRQALECAVRVEPDVDEVQRRLDARVHRHRAGSCNLHPSNAPSYVADQPPFHGHVTTMQGGGMAWLMG